MADTILPGDFIIVNKAAYGIKSPCFANGNITLSYFTYQPVKRNDILLFHQSGDIVISRCVGLPGDTLEIKDFEYHINGTRIPQEVDMLLPYQYLLEDDSLVCSRMHLCQLQERDAFEENGHKVRLFNRSEYHLLTQALPDSISFSIYNKVENNYKIAIPAHNYWVLSDNAKVPADSRYFGFINHQDLIGKAELIWFSKDPGQDFQHGYRQERILRRIAP